MIQPISIPMLDGRMMNVQVEVEDQVAEEQEEEVAIVSPTAKEVLRSVVEDYEDSIDDNSERTNINKKEENGVLKW